MFFEDFVLYWKNYFNFRGRTPRHGYWYVMLWNLIIISVLYLLLALIGTDRGYFSSLNGFGLAIYGIMGLYSIITIIPGLSLMIRRLHDTGRKWYWIWLIYAPTIIEVVIILIFFVSVFSNINNYTSSSTLLSIIGSLGIFGLLFALVNSVTAIWMIVILAQPTSPNAIGESTHGGGYVAGSYTPAFAPDPAQGTPVRGGYMAVSASSASASMVGVMGMYKGMSFPVQPGDEIIIGRDSALSHIVITENAQSVSRKHAGIHFDPTQQMYFVTDYSSNGTFREDGTRLLTNANNPLPRGTIINLGNAQNSFRLN